MHLQLQWIVAAAMSSGLGAFFFIIMLGLQQIDFFVTTEIRGILLMQNGLRKGTL